VDAVRRTERHKLEYWELSPGETREEGSLKTEANLSYVLFVHSFKSPGLVFLATLVALHLTPVSKLVSGRSFELA